MSLIVSAFLLVLSVCACSAFATNGMNMISYGGEASGMAGASLGVSDDAYALNNNPAGMSQIQNMDISFGISLLMPNLNHSDMFGNDVDGESAIFPLPSVSFVRKLPDLKLSYGIGLFAQGGMGAQFKNLTTAFGTTDETYTNVAYMKLAPSVSYELTETVFVGAALNVGYSTMKLRFFPNTSVPGTFAGMNMKDVYGLGYGGKFGIMVKASEVVTVGLVYTTQSALNYKHGTMTFSGMGDYACSVDGFNWPQSFGAGISFRPNEQWIFAVDTTWVNWSKAMDTVVIMTTAPTPMDTVTFPMKWKDQIVIAVGASCKINERWTVRGGWNYGKNPIPNENLSPLFPAIVEHHVTFGVSYAFNNEWSFDFALEHGFSKKVIYTNAGAPFGNNAIESHDQNTIHLYFERKF